MTVSEYNNCVDLYSDGLYRFVLKNIKDIDMAKDIVQETFVRLWKKAEEINFEKAKPYIYKTAYHHFIDNIRYENRFIPLEKLNTDFITHNNFSDLKDIINDALEKLPKKQRVVVLLRDYEGYSYKEIGDITNMNESQVKVYIYRARVFLKKYLIKMDIMV